VNTYDGEYGRVPVESKETQRFLVGHSNLAVYENENTVILAFQGSNGNGDWKDNLFFLPFRGKVLIPKGYRSKDEIDIHVHAGFWRNYHPLRRHVFDVVDSVINRKNDRKPIVITGHSLGGANALLCRADIMRNRNFIPDVYTFGAPSVGSKAFYEMIAYKSSVFQFRNNNDLVTHVPFWFMGYYHPETTFRVSNDHSERSGWTPFGNWKDHYPMKYYIGVKKMVKAL
jgi:triacylglycerol lipase